MKAKVDERKSLYPPPHAFQDTKNSLLNIKKVYKAFYLLDELFKRKSLKTIKTSTLYSNVVS